MSRQTPSGGKSKIKRRTLVQFSFRPNPASVFTNDSLDRREPNSCSLKLLRPMQALKNAEQFGGIFHIKPNPVITHEINRFFVLFHPPNFNPGGGSVP